ncbi:MAG TPA: hypothetical protein VGH27_03280 [Streptosporangiaceae bacterium]|jgi:hypothetical protein
MLDKVDEFYPFDATITGNGETRPQPAPALLRVRPSAGPPFATSAAVNLMLSALC